MMKLTLAALVAATAPGLVVAIPSDPPAEPEKTYMDFAIWCCFDSNENCPDACAWIADCQNQHDYGLLMINPQAGPGVIVCDGSENLQTTFPGPIPATMAALGIAPYENGELDDPFGLGISDPDQVPAVCVMKTQMKGPMLTGGRETGFTCESGGGGVDGDPHFKTWGGENFDYQGECDLKFLSAPTFAKGLGLEIQIRTKIRYDYSYIDAAVVKIGDNTLEVSGWGEYMINDVVGANAYGHVHNMGKDIQVRHEAPGNDNKTHKFFIDATALGSYTGIKVQTFKSWVSIHLDHPMASEFEGSVGMLGSYPEGTKRGRDGSDWEGDVDAFGQEWQVLASEESLFALAREPQAASGAQCILPKPTTKSASAQRKLAGAGITEEMAKDACADAPSPEFCVRDVLASQDLEMAMAGAY